MSKRRMLLPVGLVISTGLLGIFLLAGCSAAPPSIQPPAELLETPSPVAAGPTQKTAPSETPLAQPSPTFSLVDLITEEPVTTQPGESIPQDPYIVDLIQQAKQDLSQRINSPLEEIETIRFEEISWPDSSLGCPQPDMAYTQVMVEGFRIQLGHTGRIYNYHGGGKRPPFWCENPAFP